MNSTHSDTTSDAPPWNVPYATMPQGAPRQNLLDDLSAAAKPGAAVVVTSSHPNVTGFGRSRLVADYLHLHRSEFSAVWWVRAEHKIVLDAELLALLEELHTEQPRAHSNEVVSRRLRRWLRNNENWVIVFQDLETADRLPDTLPPEHKGHVIILSNHHDWPPSYKQVRVPPFEESDATAFVLKRAPQLSVTDAGKLVKVVRSHPLAVDLLTRYLTLTKRPFQETYEAARQRAEELEAINPGAPASMLTALCATFLEEIETRNPDAVAVATVCSFLHGSEITQDYLARDEGVEDIDTIQIPTDPKAVTEALNLLADAGLLHRQDSAYTMHHAIQQAIRRGLSHEDEVRGVITAVQLANSHFPSEQEYPRSWPHSLQQLIHAAAVVTRAETAHVAQDEAGVLLNKMALYARSCAALEEAQHCLERALNLAKDIYGARHDTVAIRTNNLGTFLRELGKLTEARACFEEALKISSDLNITDEPDLVCLNNLCSVLEELEDWEAAKAHYLQAMAIYEEGVGKKHPHVATIASNLGRVYHKLKNLPRAMAYLQRALVIDTKEFGPKHHRIALRFTFIGKVYTSEGNLEEAGKCFERALNIDRELFKPDNNVIAHECNDLAINSYKRKDYEAAKKYFKEALRIQEKRIGASDPEVLGLAGNLAKTMRALGDYDAALEVYKRVLDMHQKMYGKDHDSVLHGLRNLALTAENQEDYDAALDYAREALAIVAESRGEKHDDTASLHTLLGHILKSSGDLEQARSSYERARSIHSSTYGDVHETVAKDLNNIGLVLFAQGENLSALASFKRALEISEQTLGPNHRRTIQISDNLDALAE